METAQLDITAQEAQPLLLRMWHSLATTPRLEHPARPSAMRESTRICSHRAPASNVRLVSTATQRPMMELQD